MTALGLLTGACGSAENGIAAGIADGTALAAAELSSYPVADIAALACCLEPVLFLEGSGLLKGSASASAGIFCAAMADAVTSFDYCQSQQPCRLTCSGCEARPAMNHISFDCQTAVSAAIR